MAGIGGCRSSGAISADTLIFTGAGKLVSIHGYSTGTDTGYVTLHDCLTQGACNAANTLGVLNVGLVSKGAAYAEADMHGVIFKLGLFADVTDVAGTGTTFTVEFN
tara:strand:+ start:501 stop:818 length:318 start_codon:yes stop_codon:yes gene_type:complete